MKVDFSTSKLDRIFWTKITQNLDKHYKTTASWAGKLPYEERTKYLDIWLEWLKIVESAKIKPFTTLPLQESAMSFYSEVVKHSVEAFFNIYDNRIPSAIHHLIDSRFHQSSASISIFCIYVRTGFQERLCEINSIATIYCP